MTCKACNKKFRPGESNEIALEARDGNGTKVDLRSMPVCNTCFKAIIAKNGECKTGDGALAAAMEAMYAIEDSYLATYTRHLEHRLWSLHVETNLKDVDMAKLETDLDNTRDHVAFLEKIIAACKSCKALFDQIKTR